MTEHVETILDERHGVWAVLEHGSQLIDERVDGLVERSEGGQSHGVFGAGKVVDRLMGLGVAEIEVAWTQCAECRREHALLESRAVRRR